MRILVLNWRDIMSSRGGGAERVTHEVARRLVERGDKVTWLSSAEEGLPDHQVVDGVEIVRRGSELTTRRWARAVADAARPDVVVEEINTLPYFAPLWSDVPVVLYMNQIAREVWWYEAPLPLALVGRVAEPAYLRMYRDCDAITISHSTLDDLRSVGVRGAITIAPMAVDIPQADPRPEKSLTGRLVAIGRLTPSKRYDHAIRALARVRERHPASVLTLIGRGRDERRLRRLAARLGVDSAVEFAGFVTEREKETILDACDVLVGTSVREGWGLTVTEAAARGAPSVVYDIPGFRDAVVSGRTGLVVEPSPDALADGIDELLRDRRRYERLAAGAWASVSHLGYEATANAFARALERVVGDVSRKRG